MSATGATAGGSAKDERRNLALKKARVEVMKRAIYYRNTFKTGDGQECLKLLVDEFHAVPIAKGTSDEIIARAAAHDVVQYIIDMINFKGDEDGMA